MTSITITHTIYRNEDEDIIELECTGSFYRGGFEGYSIAAPHTKIVLTEKENAAIVAELTEENFNTGRSN